MSGLTLKKIVHHGVEGAACIGFGTLAFSSFSTAAFGYAAGKVAYLGTRELLDRAFPDLSKGAKRCISGGVAFGLGGFTLQALQEKITGEAVSVLTTLGKEALVTGTSLGIRTLADNRFRQIRKNL